MPTFLIGSLIIVGSVALALGLMLIIRRRVSLDALEAHNTVAGYVYNTISLMFGVLVAFVVIVVWGQYQDAKRYSELEASALTDLAFLASAFPAPESTAIRRSIVGYLQDVLSEEWPALGRGEPVPYAGADRMSALRQHLLSIEPQTERAKAAYAESLDRLSAFSDARRGRIYEAMDQVPISVWFVMLLGASFTIAFPFFFGVRSVRSQSLMTAALTALSAALLYLVFALDTPFSGDAWISPAPFQRALATVVELDDS